MFSLPSSSSLSLLEVPTVVYRNSLSLKTDTFPIDKEQYLDIITIAMNLFQVFITKFFNIFF